MTVADAVAQYPGRTVLFMATLLVSVPIWIRESRLDRKWTARD